VLATDLAPEVLDEAPLPTELPVTVALGLETADDWDPDELVALLAEPEFEVCAKATPLSMANADAVRSKRLTEILLEKPFCSGMSRTVAHDTCGIFYSKFEPKAAYRPRLSRRTCSPTNQVKPEQVKSSQSKSSESKSSESKSAKAGQPKPAGGRPWKRRSARTDLSARLRRHAIYQKLILIYSVQMAFRSGDPLPASRLHPIWIGLFGDSADGGITRKCQHRLCQKTEKRKITYVCGLIVQIFTRHTLLFIYKRHD
jgi:hypothetical protein